MLRHILLQPKGEISCLILVIGHQHNHLPGGFVQLACCLGRWVVAVGDLLIGAAGIPECDPAGVVAKLTS